MHRQRVIHLEEVTGTRAVRDFVGLPSRRGYGHYDNDAASETAWLNGTHVLGGGLTVRAAVAYDGQQPIGRIAVTTADDDPGTAWVGFLECPDDDRVTDRLFGWAHDLALARGRTRLVGPVDASFWHRYRLKVSGFGERAYLTEPLNPPHHIRLWERAGYAETDRYRSAFYPQVRADMTVPRFAALRSRFEGRGFSFSQPTPATWDATIGDLHAMLHDLYAPMAVFRPIPLDVFRAHYARLRSIADLSMVWLVHRADRPEGFCVTFPDFGTGLTTGPLWRRVATRLHRRPDRYVLAYLGARTPGIGAALMHALTAALIERRAALVGSLSHTGVASDAYGKEHIRARHHYILMARPTHGRAH